MHLSSLIPLRTYKFEQAQGRLLIHSRLLVLSVTCLSFSCFCPFGWLQIKKDLNYESEEAKQQVDGSKSTKRSRAAEVHNLSERRRRDRINEKMRALQELIPRCNKSDKASMLDEAIEYLKSLQLQVQMMSMGCGMVPMNMMMCLGMPVMPFPAHMGPSLSRMPENMLTSLTSSHPIHSRIPNLPHAYPQYLGPHQILSHFMQNQTMMQQDISKPSTSRAHENPENHPSENG